MSLQSLRVPPAIKAADLARFAMRASQLEKAKPVVSYYCDYWIVHQVIARSLHTTDEECQAYTTGLVERLEQFKAENSDVDVVTDDVAGKAYVEQFGLDTFQRANNAVRANKASRQTADTFQAAATFLELMQIWGELDQENAAKIKYAKYHALRIAKALKAGQDPNKSNPAPEVSLSDEDGLPALDPDDVEVQMLNGGDVPQKSNPGPRLSVPRPEIEEVPDESERQHPTLGQQSSLDESLHPSRAPSVPRPAQDEVSPVDVTASAEDFYNQTSNHDVSPLGVDAQPEERRPSVGGNYFPRAPPPRQPDHLQQPAQQPTLHLPSAPSEFSSLTPEPSLPPTQAAFSPTSFPQPQTQPAHPQPTPHSTQQQQHHHHQTRMQKPFIQPPPQAPAAAAAATATTKPQITDENIAASQKHARWAISALNFEDVPTAVLELRAALESLEGAAAAAGDVS